MIAINIETTYYLPRLAPGETHDTKKISKVYWSPKLVGKRDHMDGPRFGVSVNIISKRSVIAKWS
jgi:hypothetical protein